MLMDMMMPGMDGWEAAKTLRATPETKKVPILATTALFRPHELKTCLEAGCNNYWSSRFSVQNLRVELENC
jgi:CheY-like chemotaxis protein